jgi:multidrug transporter EmrE-like cation transporter
MTGRSIFLNAYLQIALGALLVTASELLLKSGASSRAAEIGVFGVAALGSARTWLGILTYCLSFASWVHVLRTIPLGIAFGLINVAHVLVPLGCWIFLGEAISPARWLGISLVIVGLVLVAKPVAAAESKLETVL